MRRLLLICLIVLLPLQTVWTAAAAACTHEETSVVSHLGHHDAHHDSTPSDGQAEELIAAEGNGPSDHHHFLSVHPLPFMPVLPGLMAEAELDQPDRMDSYPSTSIAALERPPKDFHRTLSVRTV